MGQFLQCVSPGGGAVVRCGFGRVYMTYKVGEFLVLEAMGFLTSMSFYIRYLCRFDT